jgi:DNA polymerase III subunit epsilon
MMPATVTLGNPDTLLTERAADFLKIGPADAQSLISYVCQLPGAPRHVAEHMAGALFAGHKKFERCGDGRWRLRDSSGPGQWSIVQAGELRRESYVVVDVETTGTRAYHGDRVTEVAVVQVRNGVATTVFDTLINPERSIPPAIVALTNITWEMVKDAPRFRDVCDQLLGVLEGNVFVAHNANFDWRFLSSEIERVTRRPLVGKKLCTVRMARRLVPELRRRNLDAVTSFYGISIHGRHRAGGDAVATAEVLLRLLDAARQYGCNTIEDLERVLEQRVSRRKRRRRPSAMPHSVVDDSTA